MTIDVLACASRSMSEDFLASPYGQAVGQHHRYGGLADAAPAIGDGDEFGHKRAPPEKSTPIAALLAIGVCFHTDIKLLRIMAKSRPFRRHRLAMPETGGRQEVNRRSADMVATWSIAACSAGLSPKLRLARMRRWASQSPHEDRHLEHQRRQGAAGSAVTWLKEASPDVACFQEIKSLDRGVPRRGLRGARLQCCGARAEGLQRRRHPVQAPVRRDCRARPARRRQRRACPLHRGVRAVRRRRGARRQPLPAQRQSHRHRQVRLQARLDEALRGAHARAAGAEEPFLLLGDYNVIPEPVDAKNPQAWTEDALFQPETRAAFRALVNLA